MSTQTLQPDKLPTTYEGLFRIHTLKPIHDSVGYENACEILDALSGLELNKEQSEYLEVLSILVEAYEKDCGEMAKVSGVDALRYLCEENNLSGSKLAEMLGVSRALGVKLLAGERNLTIAHIGKLAERFKVSPELFIK
ncbi:helix-turn-helix domain-containing protein [Coraliomargarita parva]|uniref:helix-turn-helix domain-containing protein n=1 Tax=Coraliomargarita parva TaxID=3014050 RepID=UPI0022B44A48|nr:helix-turn-helix domain-containing protein [Coraliomargarita parva]